MIINRRLYLSQNSIKNRLLAAVATATLPPLQPGDEIYDLRNPATVPYPWMETIIWYTGFLLSIWILFRLVTLLQKPVPEKVPLPPPPVDPLKEALSALDRLKVSPIWQEGQIKDICEALAAILKTYLKERFSLGIGYAATSDELLADLRDQNVRSTIFDATRSLMNVCDGIKFARGTLGSMTMEGLYNQTRDLIVRKDWRT